MILRTAACVLLLAAMALAQEAPGTPPSEEPETQRTEYGGPSILSRGFIPSLAQITELVRLRPYVGAHAFYDAGLTPYSVTATGEVPRRDNWGTEASFGAQGYHPWRRSLLGMQYQGRLRHNSRHSYHDGFDNTLSLNFVHRPSSRIIFAVSSAAASYSRGFFLPAAGSDFYNPDVADLTGNELFDNRVTAVSASGRLIYQKSARLSFSLGGSGFTARRHVQTLIGVDGYRTNGDVGYRLSRYQTIGVDYSFAHYEFRNLFGGTDAHGAGVNWSVQLGRHWGLGLRAGGHRVEVSRLEKVPLDPVIVAIVGMRSGITTSYRRFYTPSFNGHLTRSFPRASLSFQYNRGLSAGNDLYLTSGVENAAVSYHYSGIRRVGLGVSAGVMTRRAFVQDLGRYTNYHGEGSFSYRLGRGLSFSATAGVRRHELLNSQFERLASRFSAGINFSPGEVPFSIW